MRSPVPIYISQVIDQKQNEIFFYETDSKRKF